MDYGDPGDPIHCAMNDKGYIPVSAGTRIGPYEILAPLGTGGMGEVYRARDTRLGRDVAVKVLPPDRGDARRFAQEARAIAALNHPNICTLYDVGPDYLVMEYVEGSTLSGPLPVEEALRVALQIAQALEAAHAKGIVHRDLKPANIALTRSGVKLLDFGLAKLEQPPATETTMTQTQLGMVVGTAQYMSPEQAEGKPVDTRSDIFSFGVVFYEMLSGRRAFKGETAIAAMAAILHREPEPLNVAPEIARIVARCIRKAPADRFQTMAEVRAALADLKPAERPPSIAVLPFANMSGDKDNEYFSDGLAEEVINALTKVPGLKVIARTSAFSFRGKSEDIRRIGEALGVDHVLEGSVRRAGNRVRITAQLVAVADGCQLWSERFDREMNDIFAIQDEISQAIVDALRIKLGGTAVRLPLRRRLPNQAAYHAYLEGRYHSQQFTEAGLVRSRHCYECAIQLDPGYAAAYAGLAESHIYLTLYERVAQAEAIPLALAAAERAISIDPYAPEGYLARGLIRGAAEWNWEAAGRDFEKALGLNPESAMAHCRLGVWCLLGRGLFDQAVAATRRAIELDPLSHVVRSSYALVLHIAGQHEEAIQQVRSTVDACPDTFFSCLVGGIILGGCGLVEEAEAVLDRGLRATPDNIGLLVPLAAVYRKKGNTEGVSRIFAQLPAGPPQSALLMAILCAALGHFDAVPGWLDQAAQEHYVWSLTGLLSPLYASLLAGPSYDALLRTMHLSCNDADLKRRRANATG